MPAALVRRGVRQPLLVVAVVCVLAALLFLFAHHRTQLQLEVTEKVMEKRVGPITGPVLDEKRFLDSRATRWTSDEELHRYLTSPDVSCKESYRAGKLDDGGWDVCIVAPYMLKPPCLVYSFGINWDFSFDDAIAKHYECHVKAFDPSMNTANHRRGKSIHFFREGISGKDFKDEHDGITWNMYSFASILKKHNDTNKIIDYFKMDVELSEYEAIPAMATKGLFKNIKQIGLEIHRKKYSSHPVHLINILEDNGFRKWKMDYNYNCAYKMQDGTRTSTCLNLYYLNMRFIDKASIGSFLIR